MRSTLITFCLCLAALQLAGCAGSPQANAQADVMFRKTSAMTEGVIELTTPSLVNDIHGAFTIEELGYFTGATLAEDGRVRPGENAVFVLEFVDHGDISVLRTDDKRVSLRVEFGPEGKITAGLLGDRSGVVRSGFTNAVNDTFKEGTWELLYDGPEVVVGRFDVEFEKYRVTGNFRAPRLR
jgi:hypothetical protein